MTPTVRKRQTVIGAPENLSGAQLEARIRIHESTAAMYQEHEELGMAQKFRELAALYQHELERRRRIFLSSLTKARTLPEADG